MNKVVHSDGVETEKTYNLNEFCRLCATVDERMIPIYFNEGIDHSLERKIKTHLPFLNIHKDDLLPKRVCYHCASAVLVWNELYISSSIADNRLKVMFETTRRYEESGNSKKPFNHEPYADIEEMDNMPVKDFIEQSIEYGDITDTNIFNKIDKSDKILSQLDKIPSTSNTEDILNPEDKSSEIPENETLNPSLKSQIEIFTRGVVVDNDDEGNVDHNVYLNAVGINDIDGLPYMDCHRLDDECNGLLEPKREYQVEDEIDDQINEDVDDVDLNHYRRRNLRRQYHRHHQNVADITSNGDINMTMPCEDDDDGEVDVKPRITHLHGTAEGFLKEEGDDCCNHDDDEDEGECCDPTNLEIRQLYVNGTEEESNEQQSETMCQMCATVFKTRYNLLRHFQKRHPEYKMYECDLCRISFPSIDEFKDHLEEKHSNKSQLTTHAIDSRQVRFACDVCGNMYKNKASAMNHLLTHTAKKTVHCPRCDFTCYTKQQLGVHQTKHDKRFVCDICNKRFAQKSQLDVHVNAVHYNHRPYRCLLCSKSFKTKGSHDAHMIVHTDTRNYQCPHCDKKCRKRYDLTLHIRTHTGEKPFKCSVCGRGFVQMCDTRKHEMLHYRKGKKTALFYATDTTSALEDE